MIVKHENTGEFSEKPTTERNMKKVIKINLWFIATVLAVLAVSKAVTYSFALISSQDDLFVLCGALLLAVTGAAVTLIVKGLGKRLAKKFLPIVALSLVLLTQGCTRVSAGYAGIKINNFGSQRGVSDVPLVTGWVFYNPFTQSVFEYPCFVQTATWKDEEKFSFNLSGGTVGTAEISFSYHFDYDRVPQFYVKFRSDDIRAFTHGFLHNTARDAFNEIAPYYTVEDMYTPKKDEFLVRVTEKVNSVINPMGAHIDQFGYLHALGLPPGITEMMNAKVAAIQRGITVQNELVVAKAEAAKVVAKAEGEAQANVTLAKSISPELIQWRNLMILEQAVQRWDGRRPSVESGGGSGMLLQLPTPELKPNGVQHTASN